MNTRIGLRPLRDGDLAAAKRVMLTVAAGIFEPDHPAAAFINRYGAALSDVDDYRNQYGPPAGLFLVAVDGEEVVGTGAIRRLDDATAELRRMWLLPEYQGRRIGYRLAVELFAFARAAGYQRVRLSTSAVQERAIRFYQQLGFYPIDRYRDTDDEVFLELPLVAAVVAPGPDTREPIPERIPMPRTAINPPDLFASETYGFSQAVMAEGRRTVYCSGQVAWDTAEDIGAPGDLAGQTRRALLNVERAVSAAGGTLDDVVSLRIYIVGEHIRNTAAVRQALLHTFGHKEQPAATWIGVHALANPDFIIEIEAVAVL